MRMLLQRILRSVEGQTTVEYAIIVGFVIVIAVTSFAVLRPVILAFFTDIGDVLSTVG
jgi:Flp pilus assembly pilin Flp